MAIIDKIYPHIITNIKTVLVQSQLPIVLSYFLPGKGWCDFDTTFWSDADAEVLWDPSPYFDMDFDSSQAYSCPVGSSTVLMGPGGHAVLLYGYYDDDSDDSYWMILNSWGSTPDRPHGTFRLKMRNASIQNYYQGSFLMPGETDTLSAFEFGIVTVGD